MNKMILHWASATFGAAPLAQELLCKRTWNVADWPEWLALEAEGRLQIRCVCLSSFASRLFPCSHLTSIKYPLAAHLQT